MNVFAMLYRPYAEELATFGKRWCGPEVLTQDWATVARYEKEPADNDGQPVLVQLSAMPARFYRLHALEAPNSVGEMQPEFTIEFGSGQAELAAEIARLIAEGMLTARSGAPRE